MEIIRRSALVPYTPREMFDLVKDVDSYPTFLPWCSGARILVRDGEEVEARISFAVGGVSKTFTTRNRHEDAQAIHMQLIDGPFRHLQGSWKFVALGDDGCRIALDLEYDFASRMLAMVTGPVFNKIANSLVDAFRQRALEVYGER